jgi:ketosteroid isomerase-like protein
MNHESDVLAAELQFFTALRHADGKGLGELLTDNFLLIDVMRGAEVSRADLIAAVGSKQLTFDAIEQGETKVRFYQTTAIVTGRTRMSGRFGPTSFTTHSRYTHVYVLERRHWRLASAQGTPIGDM